MGVVFVGEQSLGCKYLQEESYCGHFCTHCQHPCVNHRKALPFSCVSETHVKQHTLTEGFTPTDEQMAQPQSDFGASDYASLICSLFCASNQTQSCAC